MNITINKYLIFLLLILHATISYSQDDDSLQNEKKHDYWFSINAGMHYNYIFNNKYIMPYVPPADDPFKTPSPGGMKQSDWGKHFGLNYYQIVYKNLFLQTGLSYFQQKKHTIANPDTLEAYYTLPGDPIIESRIVSHCIDIPLFAGYKYKNFYVLIGVKYCLYRYGASYAKSLSGEESLGKQYEFFCGTLRNDGKNIFHPSFKLKYSFIINNKLEFSAYASFDEREGRLLHHSGTEYYDMQFGVEVRF